MCRSHWGLSLFWFIAFNLKPGFSPFHGIIARHIPAVEIGIPLADDCDEIFCYLGRWMCKIVIILAATFVHSNEFNFELSRDERVLEILENFTKARSLQFPEARSLQSLIVHIYEFSAIVKPVRRTEIVWMYVWYFGLLLLGFQMKEDTHRDCEAQ